MSLAQTKEPHSHGNAGQSTAQARWPRFERTSIEAAFRARSLSINGIIASVERELAIAVETVNGQKTSKTVGYSPWRTSTPSGQVMHFRFQQSRLFEWISSFMLLGLALIVLLDNDSFRNGGFELVAKSGMTLAVFFFLTLTFGLVRIGALIANGMSVCWGPRLRMVAGLVAAFVWSHMALSLFLVSQSRNHFSLGLPVYVLLVVGELVASYGAAGDARRNRQ